MGRDRKAYNAARYAKLPTDIKVIRLNRNKQWKLDNKEQYIKTNYDARYRREYGISLDEYYIMLWLQNYVCAICEKPETHTFKGTIKRLSVDHNHDTGKVRGLLCSNCNTSFGLLQEDINIMRNMINYKENS